MGFALAMLIFLGSGGGGSLGPIQTMWLNNMMEYIYGKIIFFKMGITRITNFLILS